MNRKIYDLVKKKYIIEARDDQIPNKIIKYHSNSSFTKDQNVLKPVTSHHVVRPTETFF